MRLPGGGSAGSIPACAGEAYRRRRWRRPGSVYPRVCGGSRPGDAASTDTPGLSPRVRGKPNDGTLNRPSQRSIPACAGEAPGRRCGQMAIRVYPRVCGGSLQRSSLSGSVIGLSPRVRGKPLARPQKKHRVRSIPACAGEAWRYRGNSRQTRVYPRVCGGSAFCPSTDRVRCGLSPRVRGKRCPPAYARRAGRSIPACAGEAATSPGSAFRFRVYPRVCGGSRQRWTPAAGVAGLSPRVRGKRLTDRPQRPRRRSIPACAGEALCAPARFTPPAVYPRVCGGSIAGVSADRNPQGLSPRVRGKRYWRPFEQLGLRSIPACAGEASASPEVRISRPGLSPRVRGKLAGQAGEESAPGSIPACAGEAA